jgi:hypothetical protein
VRRPTPIRRNATATAVALVFGALLTAGCTAAASATPSPSPLAATATTGTIRMTLTLEGPTRTGAPSWASVVIENIGERGVRWAGGGCGDPGGIYVDLNDVYPAGRDDWPALLGRFKREALHEGPSGGNGFLTLGYTAESRWGTDMACPASFRIETLAGHGSLSLRAGWDGTYEGAPVPTGPATVLASFPVIGIEGEVADQATDTHPVVASIRTRIVGDGAATVLAPGLAIDAALADPEFAAWVQDGPVDRWINPDVARIGDTWQIGLFKTRAGGAAEAYQGVTVDAAGHIVGREAEPSG